MEAFDVFIKAIEANGYTDSGAYIVKQHPQNLNGKVGRPGTDFYYSKSGSNFSLQIKLLSYSSFSVELITNDLFKNLNFGDSGSVSEKEIKPRKQSAHKKKAGYTKNNKLADVFYTISDIEGLKIGYENAHSTIPVAGVELAETLRSAIAGAMNRVHGPGKCSTVVEQTSRETFVVKYWRRME